MSFVVNNCDVFLLVEGTEYALEGIDSVEFDIKKMLSGVRGSDGRGVPLIQIEGSDVLDGVTLTTTHLKQTTSNILKAVYSQQLGGVLGDVILSVRDKSNPNKSTTVTSVIVKSNIFQKNIDISVGKKYSIMLEGDVEQDSYTLEE